MDFQAVIDSMNEMNRVTRSDYHLTLGNLILSLTGANEKDPNMRVIFSHNLEKGPGVPHSYRGYYSDLAFQEVAPPTVNEFLKQATETLDKTLKGYKGGDFVMDAKTPLWVSEYGSSGNIAIIGCEADTDCFVIKTKQLEY